MSMRSFERAGDFEDADNDEDVGADVEMPDLAEIEEEMS